MFLHVFTNQRQQLPNYVIVFYPLFFRRFVHPEEQSEAMQLSLGAFGTSMGFRGADALRARQRRARSSAGVQLTRAASVGAVFEPVYNGGAAVVALGTIALPGAYWWCELYVSTI